MVRLRLLLVSLLASCGALSSHPKLLLISFDGFRYDLLNQTMVPHLAAWAEQAAWFENGVASQYITYTAPNHMSIATGLLEQHHGIVSNYFYDTETNKTFDMWNATKKAGIEASSRAQGWFKGDPIWLTNERADASRRSASLYWPGGEAAFPAPPHRPSLYREWNEYRPLEKWMADVDELVDMFTREKEPVNFAAWYVAEPDHVLHEHGFYDGALRKKLAELDKLWEYFVVKWEDRGLSDKVNVIFTADHGHAQVRKHGVMCIRDYVHGEGFEMGDHMIYPRDDAHAEAIYANLTAGIKRDGYAVRVHWKKDLPSAWGYSDSARVGRIVLEPEIGASLSFSCTTDTFKVHPASSHGHTPDKKEMRAALVMRGPAFGRKRISEVPSNVDLYGLMCRLLDVTPAPNNGTIHVVKRALRDLNVQQLKNEEDLMDALAPSLVVFPLMLLVAGFMLYACRRTVVKEDASFGRADASSGGYRRLALGMDEEEEGDEDDLQLVPMRAAGPMHNDRLMAALESSDEEV